MSYLTSMTSYFSLHRHDAQVDRYANYRHDTQHKLSTVAIANSTAATEQLEEETDKSFYAWLKLLQQGYD